jgi:DNA-directed RNA polymerase subunit RPC12/RpoP
MKDSTALRSNEAFFIEVDREKEIRCPNCEKLFAKGTMGDGAALEYKCPRCKELVTFRKL